MRLIGLDPGLRHTGWGVIDAAGNRLSHVADGVVHTQVGLSLAERLGSLYRALNAVLDRFAPEAAAVEETFVNKNAASTLRLGMARGVVLLAPAERGLPVFEYATNLVKKSVVGGGACREGAGADDGATASARRRRRSRMPCDALAVAICHAHHAATARAVALAAGGAR